MRKHTGALLVSLLFLGACATTGPETARRFEPALYERHAINGNWLRLHWNLSGTEQGVTAEGYAENIGDSLTRVKHIRLWLVGYDEEGREVVRSKAVPPFPSTLLTRDNLTFPRERETYGIFHIKLPDSKSAARFEVVARYIWDIYPQDEDEDRQTQWRVRR